MPVFIGGAAGAASMGHTRLAGNDWHGRNSLERSNEPPPEDWSEGMRELQLSVATTTFSVLLGVGFFCTCLYLACCRQKHQRRIRGKAYWGQDHNATYGISTAHGLDPNGLSLDPYMVSPYVQSQLFGDDGGRGPVVLGLEGENGFYHYPMENKSQPLHDPSRRVKTNEANNGQDDPKVKDGVDVKLDVGDVTHETGTGQSEPYKPFLPRMKEWEPPTDPPPPSYHGTGWGGHDNPVYTPSENGQHYGDKLAKVTDKQPEAEILRKLRDLGTEFGLRAEKGCEIVNYAEIHASPYNPEFILDPKQDAEKGKPGNDVKAKENK